MDIADPAAGDGQSASPRLFEDEDAQNFYENLPELKLMLPGILFKDSEQPTLPVLEDKIEDEDENEVGCVCRGLNFISDSCDDVMFVVFFLRRLEAHFC